MRKLIYISATMLALFAINTSHSVAYEAATSEGSATTAPTQPAEAVTHNSAGAGTQANHPKHGKLHGHHHVAACMKHCDQHHQANGGTNDDVAACKKLCAEQHKKHQVTNPAGRKGKGAPGAN